MQSFSVLRNRGGVLAGAAAAAGLWGFVGSLTSTDVQNHCQVPCGIYDDEGRIKRIKEDATTIRKSMRQIEILRANEKDDALSFNQASRWVATKELHASHIISVVSEYFLTQKIKEVAKDDPHYQDYLETLALHHSVMRAAMRAKQNVDEHPHADDLDHAISHLESVYSASS
eukprot:g1467.t1